jgi:hypothetical protein
MKRRCEDPVSQFFHLYGGRGISLCQRWHDFDAFISDVGPRPSKNHSIDRIDNDGNYSCGICNECLKKGWVANCRWATDIQQQRNKSDSHLLSHEGRTMCVTEWAELLGVKPNALFCRLRNGWSVEKTLTTPVRK